MNAALHYTVEAFDTSKPKLMGRHAAGEGFLRGYARHAAVDEFLCYAKTPEEFADFEARIAGFAGKPRPCRWIAHQRSAELAAAGCLVYPAPGLGPLAWQRRHSGSRSYSLCGTTHTTASNGVMDGIGDMMVAPLQPWDAVICTSRAVRDTVAHVHARWGAYLEARFGGTARAPLQLPIIPLGVECDEFAPSRKTGEARNRLRQRLGIAEDDVAVLFVGRLSFHAKAHPLPMCLGLAEAARRTGKRIHLIQAGWFANDSIKKNFVEAAKVFCPDVSAVFLDGREPAIRANVWFAADIFASLSDNVQETFGLTPVEAMAAGLPAVISDWNGYRDNVRDGIEGILVPSFLPPPGAGEIFAYRQEMGLDDYDRYIGNASQCGGADIRAASEAFAALVGDAALRRRMGEAGRARAREIYDWRVVVAAYQTLWRELAKRRRTDSEVAPRPAGAPANPLREDPFAVFAGYPSLTLGAGTVVAAVSGGESAISRIRSVYMNTFAGEHLAPPPEMKAMLARIAANGPLAVGELLDGETADRQGLVLRSLGWLGKMGLVAFEGLKPKPPE